MADLSLDEIIAKKKGLKMFKVQLTNGSGLAQKFTPRVGQQGGFQQKRSLSKHAMTTPSSARRGNLAHSNGSHLAGPGKGQIDARDMITIKNRIKMPDARVKIVQKRIGQRTFDARSKLQSRMLPRGGTQQLVPQPQLGFQSQQRFQSSPTSRFSQPPGLLHSLQGPEQRSSADLVNFTVAVSPSLPSSSTSRPIEPLTRTLQNPLASGGALVENTGSSLKITRAIPDVTFDGKNLTVTRRLSQNSQKQNSALSVSTSRPRISSDRGPVIQFQNDKFQSTPDQPPSASNTVRSRQPPSQERHRRRAPSPIQAPGSSKRAPAKPPRAEDSALKKSLGYLTDTRYKAAKNATVFTPTSKTQKADSVLETRLRISPSPEAAVPTLQAKRPAPLGSSSSQHPAHSDPIATKSSKSSQPVSKRLAPRPSAQTQSGGGQRGSGTSKALKRRAPMSLSERFSSRDLGSASPVIIDLVPSKKRRVPEPEPDKEELEEEEVKEEGEEEEEEPEAPVISPLQGFRMLVSNLHSSVTQDDIIELFGAIGPLKRANLLTKGQAEVAFIHREHAVLALKKYHNRELDGQPMFVKVTTPLNAKVMKPPASEESTPGLPPSLRSNKKVPGPSTASAPVEIPLIHKALFKTGTDSAPSKSVRFTVKL